MLSRLNSLFGFTADEENPEREARTFIARMRQLGGGDVELPFQECSGPDFCRQADSGMFLFVYLHSRIHENADQFVRDTMSSPRLKEFIEGGRYTCWGGDVWCADALRMASYLKVTGYPFVGVLWRSGTTLKRLYAHEGCISAEELVNSITEHVQSVQQELQQQAARDESIEGERRLREEQNRAYEEALAADQRRAEAEQREAEEKSLAEAVKISVMEERQVELERRRSRLSTTEPPKQPSGDPGCTTEIRFHFPDGCKVTRRFLASSPVQELYDFAAVQLADRGHGAMRFHLATNFPRRTLSEADTDLMQSSMQEAKLFPREMIFVTPEDDTSDEASDSDE